MTISGTDLVYFEGSLLEEWQDYTTTTVLYGARPYGLDEEGSLAATAGYISAVMLGAVLFCCFAVWFWSSRKRAVGVYKLPFISKSSYATFHVKERRTGTDDKTVKHVVWDLSQSQADSYFRGKNGQDIRGLKRWDNMDTDSSLGLTIEGEPLAVPPSEVSPISSPRPVDDEASPRRPLEEAMPILPKDSVVEYYSSTWNVWLQGVLSVVREGSEANPRFAYDIVVDSGRRRQVRHNVPLNGMRRVMWTNEAVEVWLPGGRGWAPGVIADDHKHRFAILGYKVRVGDEVIQVPRHMVRRRFDHGDVVRVYQGPGGGWAPATVDRASAASAGIDRGAAAAALVPHSQPGAAGEEVDNADDEFADEIEKGTAAEDALPWTLVPVSGLGDDGQCKFIPSYLLMPPESDLRSLGGAANSSGVTVTFGGEGNEFTHTFTDSFLGFGFAKVPPVVTHVVPKSQADDFGVVPGMAVVAIGGHQLAGMPFANIERTLQDAIAALPKDPESLELWSMEI